MKRPWRPQFDQSIDIKIALHKISTYVHIKNVYEKKWLFILQGFPSLIVPKSLFQEWIYIYIYM